MSVLVWLLGLAALAGEDAPKQRPDVAFDWGGHVKLFATASIPYAVEGLPDDVVHDLLNPLPDEPVAQGFLDGRLRLGLTVDWFEIEGQHAITTFLNADSGRDQLNAEVAEPLLGDDGLSAFAELSELAQKLGAEPGQFGSLGAASAGGGPFQTGVGLRAPEAFPLTWWAWNDTPADLRVQGRTDRLALKFNPEGAAITIGRQPISFGSGLFFTPLDLVSPFTPAVIDTEYKPGVDAVRIDGFFGTATQLTALVAYVGDTYVYEDPEGEVPTAARVSAAGYGQTTVGVTDLGLLYSFNRGDHVVGALVQSGIGPVGIHGDVAVTVPRPDLEEDVFVRAVVGLDGRPTGTTTLMGEVYVQSFGSDDVSSLFDTLSTERARRGEVWLGGLAYASFSVSQEITPLIIGNLGVIANLTDPSFLLTPSVSWDVASNCTASFGGFVGLGARPEGRRLDVASLPTPPSAADLSVITPRSEFGTYPASLFVRVSTYF